MTSISLCSCLITCSMTKASPRTTRVIRDTEGSSVSPTDRLSMLYPRAENSPATRDSTPNLFSTSTAIVCFSMAPASLNGMLPSLSSRSRSGTWPLCPHFTRGRGQDHVAVGAAGGHHREHALVLVHADVHHHRRGSA